MNQGQDDVNPTADKINSCLVFNVVIFLHVTFLNGYNVVFSHLQKGSCSDFSVTLTNT